MDDDYKAMGYYNGQIFASGVKCYKEGTKGLSTGNHVHLEVTEGWQTKKSYQNGQFLLNNISDVIKNVFYQLEGFNYEKNLNGYTFKKVTSRTVKNSNNPPTPPIPVNKIKNETNWFSS